MDRKQKIITDMRKPNQKLGALLFVVALTYLSGCSKPPVEPAPVVTSTPTPRPTFSPYPTPTPRPTFTPYPTPTPRPVGKMIKPVDVLNSQEALTASDIKLMLRTNFPQAEILQSIHERGLVEAITGTAAAELASFGASSAILADASNFDYVLTPSELERYRQRQSKNNSDKMAIASQFRAEQREKYIQQNAEAQRQYDLQDQMIKSAKQASDAQAMVIDRVRRSDGPSRDPNHRQGTYGVDNTYRPPNNSYSR